MANEQIKQTDEPTMAQVVARLAEIQAQTLAFQQQSLKEDRLVRRRENATDPGISAFSYPEGEREHPKPRLGRWEGGRFIPRATYWPRGVKLREELMTPEEIEAFNAITQSCTARDGLWTATVTRSGTTETLEVHAPVKSPDDRMNLPNGLLLILRELREGPAAVDVNHMAAEIADLKRRMAAMTSAPAA